jgi:hypothetical protein
MADRLDDPVVKKQKKGIDLNTALQWANTVFMISTWYSYYHNGQNEYVNFTTICLGAMLSAEISIFLLIEKKRRDPFVIILCLQLVFYYVLRILTLSIYHFSVVFARYPFKAYNLNYAIIFILIANIAIFGGLYLNKVKKPVANTNSISPYKPHIVFLVLIFAYLMTFPGLIGLSSLTPIIGLLTAIFINISAIMFMIIIYVMLFFNALNKNIRILLVIGLMMYVLLATLTGSRSAVITISYFVLFSYLTIYRTMSIKKIYLILLMLLIPVLVLFFTLATYLRPRLENRAVISSETINVINEFDWQETFKDNNELIFSPIFDRIGFLDYGAEIISNKDKYSSIFNFSNYSKSIIDNVLTPGFDVFDTPLSANALTFIYNNYGTPQKSKEKDSYQSDEFTIYGEAYALMGGWFSIIPIFFIAFAFKRLYVKIKDRNEFRFYVKRGFVLYTFFSLLNSFGIDWILLIAVTILFTYMIFKYFFKVKYNIGLTAN